MSKKAKVTKRKVAKKAAKNDAAVDTDGIPKKILKRSVYLLWCLLGGFVTLLVVSTCTYFCGESDKVKLLCSAYNEIHEFFRGCYSVHCELNEQATCGESEPELYISSRTCNLTNQTACGKLQFVVREIISLSRQ